MWPKLCLHPDDSLRVEGRGLVGTAFAVNGGDLLMKLEVAASAHVAGSVVELSVDDQAPDVEDELVLRRVNSSLSAYARCHLAWLRALMESWELQLVDDSDPQVSRGDVAARLSDVMAVLDGGSPFWDDMAYQMEDLGVPTAATHEWLVGRVGLPAT